MRMWGLLKPFGWNTGSMRHWTSAKPKVSAIWMLYSPWTWELLTFCSPSHCRYSVGICSMMEKLWKTLRKITTMMINTNMCLLFIDIFSGTGLNTLNNLCKYHKKWILLFPSFLHMKTLRLKKVSNCSKPHSSLRFLFRLPNFRK